LQGAVSVDKTRFGINRADVVVAHGKKDISILEVKTSGNVRRNIREALGQLLDYACWYPGLHIRKLVIVAPGRLGREEFAYFKRVSARVEMSLEYWEYNRKDRGFRIVG